MIQFLLLLHLIFAANANDCESWPSELRQAKVCYNLPRLEKGSVDSTCLSAECNDKKLYNETLRCVEQCFLRKSSIVTATGSINKTVVKDVYKSSFSYKMHFKPGCEEMVNSAVDSCEMNSSGSLSHDIAAFDRCAQSKMLEQCTPISSSFPGCDTVLEQCKKCKIANYRSNCSDYHFVLPPSTCCQTPEVITTKTWSDCRQRFGDKELFQDLNDFMVNACVLNETKLMAGGKFDVNVIKKMLIDNSNNSVEWRQHIEFAANLCSNLTSEKLSSHFESCIENNLARKCPENAIFNTTQCRYIHQFLKDCPEVDLRKFWV